MIVFVLHRTFLLLLLLLLRFGAWLRGTKEEKEDGKEILIFGERRVCVCVAFRFWVNGCWEGPFGFSPPFCLDKT